jgi:hypothetical protein
MREELLQPPHCATRGFACAYCCLCSRERSSKQSFAGGRNCSPANTARASALTPELRAARQRTGSIGSAVGRYTSK